jgi:hypothetical protein
MRASSYPDRGGQSVLKEYRAGYAGEPALLHSLNTKYLLQGRTPGDCPTIGLILCAEKNEAIARYSILNEHEQLFAARYVTYLPSVEELELERDRRIAEAVVEKQRAKKSAKVKRGRRQGRRS